MATSTSFICSLCQEDDETKTAVKWCAECEVFLCSECQKHHGRFKMSKKHQVMSVHDYQNLPEFMLNIKNNCDDHDLKYELFCSFHDSACCMKCIKDKHDNCKGLVPLSEVVGNIKSSAFVSQVETDLIDLLENLKTIKLFFSENLSALEKQKTEAITRVHNMRQSINDHLDKLEECLLNDISSEFTKLQETIGNLKSEIDSKTDQVEEKQNDFSKMVEFSTDLQTYFGLHEVEKIIKQGEQYIKNLKSADNLREKEMKVDCFDLESIVRGTTALGKMSIYLSPENLQLKTKGEGQVQSPLNPVLSIVKPVIKQRFKMPKHPVYITGCQILPNSDVVFVDQENKSLLLFNNAGVFVKEIMTFKDVPSDICYVRQREVAVTLIFDQKVFIIDVERNRIVRRKSVDGKCYGICTYEQMMYVIAKPKSVLALDFDLNIKNSIPIVAESLSRIAVFGDRVYCTHLKGGDKIVCYSKEGEKIWSFNHEIHSPFGIDVDKYGFVYAACNGSNSIIALSQDGTKAEVIMSEDSGVNKPLAINIDRELSVLAFSNANDEFFLLSIKEEK